MSTKPVPVAVRIVSLLFAGLAAGVLAFIAHLAGNDSMAKGIVMGAGATIVIAIVLWALGRRAGAPGRIATGQADERESRILTEAGSDAAFVMLIAGVVGTIGSLYDWHGAVVGAIVLWSGLLTVVVSFFVRLRRS